MKLVIVFLLVGVAFAHKSHKIWSTLENKYGPLTLNSDENQGPSCEGVVGGICGDTHEECGKLYLCIPGIKDPFVSACPDKQTCNAGVCSTTPNGLCEYQGLAFKCNTLGMYPEPSSCKKYNFCTPPAQANKAAIPGDCEEGFGYNPITTLCDKPLQNKTCPASERVVPSCSIAGQNGPLKNTSSYYYICLPHPDNTAVLFPNIYKCEGNKKYVGNYQCK